MAFPFAPAMVTQIITLDYDDVHVEPINNSFYRLTENIWGGSHNLLTYY